MMDQIASQFVDAFAARRSFADLPLLREEYERKFLLADPRGLKQLLQEQRFVGHAVRSEFDLYFSPQGEASDGAELKVRFVSELHRLTLIAKQRRLGDEANMNGVYWRDFPANGALLNELARRGLLAIDAVAKGRELFTKDNACVSIDRLAGVGFFAEVGVSTSARGDRSELERDAEGLVRFLVARLGKQASGSYLEIARLARGEKDASV